MKQAEPGFKDGPFPNSVLLSPGKTPALQNHRPQRRRELGQSPQVDERVSSLKWRRPEFSASRRDTRVVSCDVILNFDGQSRN
jgi:hypothetical protein